MLNSYDAEEIYNLIVYKKVMDYCLRHNICYARGHNVLSFDELYKRMRQEEREVLR